ncbi:glycoside hydrolase family 5 protein [Candidatus Poribacteria bacterium]|nr:glycoside hydrolase family 5 protein [Candidatus Poribacteria bacterium]
MERWSADRAAAWYRDRDWICGFNYVPSVAVNSTEMWQQEAFDPETIDRELGWTASFGMNACRVFIQYVVWDDDPAGMSKRLGEFLSIAGRHGIATMPVLFDDCAFAGKQPYLGRQDEPVPGVHNSGWTPSPGHDRIADRSAWDRLEAYVAELVGAFADDERILLWDLYNEPGNERMGDTSLPLVQASFQWARSASPSQPLSVGVWTDALPNLNRASLELSDVVTFHNYGDLNAVEAHIGVLREHGRPIINTEWLRRTGGSHVATHLPVFRREKVGCFCWGLVNGRIQTHFPWGSPQGAPEPDVWFHDLLRANGEPYDPAEIETFRAVASPCGRRAGSARQPVDDEAQEEERDDR